MTNLYLNKNTVKRKEYGSKFIFVPYLFVSLVQRRREKKGQSYNPEDSHISTRTKIRA